MLESDKGYVVYKDFPVPSTVKKKLEKGQKKFLDAVKQIEGDLDHFDAGIRRRSLEKLVLLNLDTNITGENVNLHVHTFFSYNASSWSPSRFAWETKKAGLYAAGIIDFDVLDGVEEFMAAAELLELRALAGLETRTFHPAYANVEIDSPGEPGVHYVAGSGFVRLPEKGSEEEKTLAFLRETAKVRNQELIARINAKLPDIMIDYAVDVVPRTPQGNPTERHIVSAYVEKSRAAFPSVENLAAFWSDILKIANRDMLDLLPKTAQFEEKVRARLAKQGGLGYVKPGPESFPAIDKVFTWMKACGAIPTDSWLDGCSEGERNGRELLECNRSLGAAALNIIPDRNWNVADPEKKKKLMENLRKTVALANEFHMPIQIGTEGNKAGLPFVDDLEKPELAPFKSDFLRGARILTGHALLSRFCRYSYVGPEAEAEYGKNIRSKNAFFESAGALPPPGREVGDSLRSAGPEKSLEIIRNAVWKGGWK